MAACVTSGGRLSVYSGLNQCNEISGDFFHMNAQNWKTSLWLFRYLLDNSYLHIYISGTAVKKIVK